MATKVVVDLDQPRWKQDTYSGRLKHFVSTCNPLNVFASEAQLKEAKAMVQRYKKDHTLPAGKGIDDLWESKKLYDSTFHPDTGEMMWMPGRMSFQVWGNMFIVGGMLTFYRSTPAVIFWQWFNQSFNALVNYTNRNAKTEVTTQQLGLAYCTATAASIATAVGLNKAVGRTRFAGGLVGRFVPLVAVWAANFVNIPLMRQMELRNGVIVADEDGKEYGKSRIAAKMAVTQVALSRCAMATPGCTIPPIIMSRLETGRLLTTLPFLNSPICILLCGACLTFATPACCAIFEQKSSVKPSDLEPDFHDLKVDKLYYNKGL